MSNAAIATTVLPDPTSPWSNRFIGCDASISRLISSSTLSCARVSVNGRDRKNECRSAPPPPRFGVPRSSESCFFLSTTAICVRKNSSKTSRLRARSSAAGVSGKCILYSASRGESNRSSSLISGQSISGALPAYLFKQP